MVERQIGKVKDAGSRSGGAAFDTFRLGQRSSTFVKICRKSLIFIMKFSTGKSDNLFVTLLLWTVVLLLHSGCRTFPSTFLSWILVCNVQYVEGTVT